MSSQYVCLWSICVSEELALHPSTNEKLSGQFQTHIHSLIFTENTMNQILSAAQLSFSDIKALFHPHRIHINIEYDEEMVEAASVSYNDIFNNYRAQELGFRITLTPQAHTCIACQHGLTIKG